MSLDDNNALGMEFAVLRTSRDRLEKNNTEADRALLKNIFFKPEGSQFSIDGEFKKDVSAAGGNFNAASNKLNRLVQLAWKEKAGPEGRFEFRSDGFRTEDTEGYINAQNDVIDDLLEFGGSDFQVLLNSYLGQGNQQTDKRLRAGDKLKDTAYEICKVVDDFFQSRNRAFK